MSKCPKCGCTNIQGPRYVRDYVRGERLLYTCLQCGYVARELTNDRKAEMDKERKGWFSATAPRT